MDGKKAVGFKCPRCFCKVAYVIRIALPQIELRCLVCRKEFAVEP